MYVKLFSSLYQGTLRGNSHGILVFTNLLAHCDRDGVADIHPRAIAEEVGLSVDAVKQALHYLESEDAESRTPDDGGRRIVRVDEHRAWGWRVVNYAKYRAIKNDDDRREANRIAVAKHRAKAVSSPVIIGNRASSMKAQGEGEGEAKGKGDAYLGASHLDTGEVSPDLSRPSGASGEQASPVRKKRVSRQKEPSAGSAEVWASYSVAYVERYGVQPVRNAKVNAQLSQLVQRLGSDEAPGVARFYVSHRNGLYVSSKHCTDLLLRDAEKLRTEWVTGQSTYQRDAREEDRLASTGAMIDRVEQRLAQKGIV